MANSAVEKTISTQELKEKLLDVLHNDFQTTPEDASDQQVYEALSKIVVGILKAKRRKFTVKTQSEGKKKVYYLSMEFLMGRSLKTSLYNLEMQKQATKVLKDMGISINGIYECEPDAGLGNGGLGRLAACYLDALAADGYHATGYSICYEYGIFKQKLEDGWQTELPDNWLPGGSVWLVPVPSKAVEVRFDGELKEYWDNQYHCVTHENYTSVMAVPYDLFVSGYNSEAVSKLRLWKAEMADFDMSMFNQGDYQKALSKNIISQAITKVLYPNDNCEEGKILRLKQEYFFSSASVTDIIKKHLAKFGTLDNLGDYITIQLNDTHPVIAVPELIRQLCAEHGYDFDKAFEIAHKVFNYTNHTIMAEALEKWDCRLVEKVVPEVYTYILMINERFIKDMYTLKKDREYISKLAPVGDGMVKMAFMAIYVSSYINGVAAIHTEILKKDALKDWYELYPERFQNKTNGITQRRWLALCNPELSALITKLLGNADWVENLDELKKLEKYADDEAVLNEFMAVKEAQKNRLAAFVKEHDGVDIDPNTIFDIQIKRLHEYKRQFLNALSILYIYYGIKDGSIKDFTPTTFIFGAKSAPGYRRAKAIIKLIGEISKLVNADPDTKDLIKVVFVQNYNVSYAEKLVTAADVSEQISTAGTEASGTGNMKLMLNGAVTLGTYDGANVEIVQEAGEENNYIFGARVEELAEIMPKYDPREILFSNDKIKRVLDKLIDGSLSDGGVPSNEEGSFKELYKALTDGASWHVPDHYYVLGDLESYVQAKLKVNADYKDKLAFAKKCWLNIANAGKFSSDRTIKDYAENIWKIEPVKL